MRTILVVDDHPIVLDGLRNISDSREFEFELARTPSEAIRRLRREPQPELLLLDIHLGTESGFSLINEWKSTGLEIPFAILTASRDWDHLQKARQFHARGYLLKTSHSSEILNDLRLILSGEAVFPSFAQSPSTAPDELIRAFHTLTDREKDVLKCIHAGLLNREIADRLTIGVRTVETHRAHAMDKLGVKSSVQLSLALIQIQHLFPVG